MFKESVAQQESPGYRIDTGNISILFFGLTFNYNTLKLHLLERQRVESA
jgi:hypothetical protein